MALVESATIEVLLATYNGERFLTQQIDSILQQIDLEVRVLARDDGSVDGTLEILREYEKRYPTRFHLMPSFLPTGSPKGNFLHLMRASTARYISFADQDDIWLPDKLKITKIAMDRLEAEWGEHAPLLVFSDLKVVDDELRTIYDSFWAKMGIDPCRMDRLAKLLVQSVVTGCTALFNRPLLKLALRMPEEALLHDRWIALLASTLGKSSAVRAPTVLYRQHDKNAVGLGINAKHSGPGTLTRLNTAPDNPTRSWFACVTTLVRLGDHAAQWEVSQRQAQALLRVHGAELSASAHDIIDAYLRCQNSNRLFTRIALLLRYGFFYRGLMPNLLTLLYLSMNRRAVLGEGKTQKSGKNRN